MISIHAPVKGATGFRIVIGIDGDTISIHAPVKGATRFPQKYFIDVLLFQSTHP